MPILFCGQAPGAGSLTEETVQETAPEALVLLQKFYRLTNCIILLVLNESNEFPNRTQCAPEPFGTGRSAALTVQLLCHSPVGRRADQTKRAY